MPTHSKPCPVVLRHHSTADAEWQSLSNQEEAHQRAQHASASPLSPRKLQYQILLASLVPSLLSRKAGNLPLQQTWLPTNVSAAIRRKPELPRPQTTDRTTEWSPASRSTEQCVRQARQGSVSTSEETFTVHDARKLAHEERIKELLGVLSPLDPQGDRSSTILIAWGEPDNCRVLPVKISHGADDVQMWEHIRNAYYSHRGKWREKLPCFGVKQVAVAKVRNSKSHG